MIPTDGVLVGVYALIRDRDVIQVRRIAGHQMDQRGARTVQKTRFVTAVSEIARNVVMHGGGGEARIYIHSAPSAISVICTDNGPGIADMQAAFRDGFSTAGSMGRGLGGAKRLSDELELVSEDGKGTRVTMMARI
ncbi:ATP-binding protein [Phaeobacter porticola]|uniref:Serine/threonine-protein kinase RsbT-like protein n=1 Tax=Phaeobacter porticola TaxID=1844006 RepID=A0A1L3IA71_9RHOB|nr:ATP-binding protein [Phaeobacter porticola]APG48974.1 serine/threonine-protein kinase RsbT-like protein [Phaeobacter porticola]